MSAPAHFRRANEQDDISIRDILRESPIQVGRMSLSLEREPDSNAFARVAAPVATGTIVYVREDGDVGGFATRAVREAFIDGKPTRVAFIELHLDDDHRANAATIAAAYRMLRELHAEDGATRVELMRVRENDAAMRQVIEAPANGLPTHTLVADLVTLVMRVRRSGDWIGSRAGDARKRVWPLGIKLISGAASDAQEIAALLQRGLSRYDFAPRWTAELLESGRACPNLAPGDFVLATLGGRLLGCAAIWDQRPFRQVVVDGYTRPLALVRPMWNAFAPLLGRPRLPAIDEFLPIAFASHLVTLPEADPRVVWSLIESLHALAEEREIDWLAVSFAADDPQLATIREAFGGREVRDRVYRIEWDERQTIANNVRTVRPEIAVMG